MGVYFQIFPSSHTLFSVLFPHASSANLYVSETLFRISFDSFLSANCPDFKEDTSDSTLSNLFSTLSSLFSILSSFLWTG